VYFLLVNLQWPQTFYWTLKAHLNEWKCHSIIYTIANQVAFQETQRKYSFQARWHFLYKHRQRI